MASFDRIRRSYWRLDDLLLARSIMSGAGALAAAMFLTAGDGSDVEWWVATPVILVFLTNIPFFYLAGRGAGRWVSWGLVLVDSLFISMMVAVTSGVESSAAAFYVWPIIIAGLLLGARASYLIAGLCASLYLALAMAESNGWHPRDFLAAEGISAGEGLEAVALRITAFLLIALLTGMLSNALLQSNADLLETKASLEQELRRIQLTNRRLVIMDEVGRALGTIQDLQVLLPRALSRVASFMAVDAGMITVFARETGEPRILARQNIDEVAARNLFASDLPTNLEEIEEYVVGETSEGRYENTLRQLDREGFFDFLAAPLRLGDESLGTLYLFTRPQHRFRKADVNLLRSLTVQLSIAIKNVLFTQELRDANEELMHLDQLKSDFLATMSHELRTPLTSIIGYSDMLLSGMTGDMTDRQKTFVRNVLNNGENLLNLINDILDLTKIEAGKLELNLEPVDLRDCLASVLSTITPKAKEKRIRVGTFLPTDLTPLRADATKLGQILLNLLSNAVKYTPEGGSISVEARRDREGMVQIRVVDTGIGLDKTDLDSIFERFTQVDSSATRNQGGTGLGLAITRDLIHLHGGSISVQSQLGEGSSFVFTIPPAVRQENPAAVGATA